MNPMPPVSCSSGTVGSGSSWRRGARSLACSKRPLAHPPLISFLAACPTASIRPRSLAPGTWVTGGAVLKRRRAPDKERPRPYRVVHVVSAETLYQGSTRTATGNVFNSVPARLPIRLDQNRVHWGSYPPSPRTPVGGFRDTNTLYRPPSDALGCDAGHIATGSGLTTR